jgi:hypothetical protein
LHRLVCPIVCPSRRAAMCAGDPCLLDAALQAVGAGADDPLEQALARQVALCTVASREPGTWGTYRYAMRAFQQWCSERNPPRASLPASSGTVAMYLMWVTQHANTFSTVKTASAAIYSYHRLTNSAESVTDNPMVNAVRETAKRALGTAVHNRKQPLDFEVLARYADWAVRSGQFLPMLAATVMLVGFCGFMRYSDLCKIYVDEIHFHEGHMEIFLETRKNDVLREGSVIVFVAGTGWRCPMQWTKWLINKVGLSGHVRLFQRFDGMQARWKPETARTTYGKVPGHVGEAMLYDQLQRLVLGGVAKEMGLSYEQVVSDFGTQSMRSGGATLVAAAGVPDRVFQRHGGWRSVGCKNIYVQDSLEERLSVTKAIDQHNVGDESFGWASESVST